MTRHSLAALARGTVAAIAGWAILYALARYLGWWSIPLVLGGAVWERVRWTDGRGRFASWR